jgi:protein-tyrosine-phosphatase
MPDMKGNYSYESTIKEPGRTMKVLFICNANVGRSQVAQAYFEALSRHRSDSAGIAANERIAAMKLASRKLKDNPNQSSMRYIRRELGRDIGEKDLVVVIAEKERWPGYLKECDKVLFWDIQDPVDMAHESANEVYRQVQRRVEQLVVEIG